MRRRSLPIHTLWLSLLHSLVVASASELNLAHPLSSQFPPVARVGQPFSWTISSSTFQSSASSNLSYTATHLPSWLHFDTSTLTFSGQPTDSDTGTITIDLSANAGGSLLSTTADMVVTSVQGPVTINDPLSRQLASNDTAIWTCYPYLPGSAFYPGVRVPPAWSFSLGFEPYTFQAPTQVFYQAAQSDGSSLPDWLTFNNETVTFDGVAPSLANTTALYHITLVGSDYYGYAEVKESFNISIAAHQLDIEASSNQLSLNLTSETTASAFLYDTLSSLTIDNELVTKGEITNISVSSLPDWLQYDQDSWTVTGTPPASANETILPIMLQDMYGDELNTTLVIKTYPSVFTSDQLGPIFVNASGPFGLQLGPYLSNKTDHPLNVSAVFDPARPGSTLSFVGQQLHGYLAPSILSSGTSINLTAIDTITHAVSRASLSLASEPNTLTSVADHVKHGLSNTAKAVLGAATALIAILVGLALALLLRGHKRKRKALASRGLSEQTSRGGSRMEKHLEADLEMGEVQDLARVSYMSERARDPFVDQERGTGVWQYLEKTSAQGRSRANYAGTSGRWSQVANRFSNLFAAHGHITSANDTPARGMSSYLWARIRNAFALASRSSPRGISSADSFQRIHNPPILDISLPVVVPSFSNAAFQAQVASDFEAAGILQRNASDFSSTVIIDKSPIMGDEPRDVEGMITEGEPQTPIQPIIIEPFSPLGLDYDPNSPADDAIDNRRLTPRQRAWADAPTKVIVKSPSGNSLRTASDFDDSEHSRSDRGSGESFLPLNAVQRDRSPRLDATPFGRLQMPTARQILPELSSSTVNADSPVRDILKMDRKSLVYSARGSYASTATSEEDERSQRYIDFSDKRSFLESPRDVRASAATQLGPDGIITFPLSTETPPKVPSIKHVNPFFPISAETPRSLKEIMGASAEADGTKGETYGTSSDLTGESDSVRGVVIETARRISTPRSSYSKVLRDPFLDGGFDLPIESLPASPSSMITRATYASPVLFETSKLVSFGDEKTVTVTPTTQGRQFNREVSHTAEIVGASESASTINPATPQGLDAITSPSSSPIGPPPAFPLPPVPHRDQSTGSMGRKLGTSMPQLAGSKLTIPLGKAFRFSPRCRGVKPIRDDGRGGPVSLSECLYESGRYLTKVEVDGQLVEKPSWMNWDSQYLSGIPREVGMWEVKVLDQWAGKEVIGGVLIEVM